MPTTHIRPFARADRIGLTGLVNAHLAAVIPGASTSVQALLSHLESEPGEFIVDRWVTDRRTLVAEQDGRIVAAAHLLRYGDGPEVGPSYRDAAEIAWLVCWPDAPFWTGSEDAGWAVLEAAVGQLAAWRASRWYADGSLPAPGAYGVPDVWPHIRDLYQRAGFSPGREEVVLACPVADLPSVRRMPGRSLGGSASTACGSRQSATGTGWATSRSTQLMPAAVSPPALVAQTPATCSSRRASDAWASPPRCWLRPDGG